jgi:uncharacterized protein
MNGSVQPPWVTSEKIAEAVRRIAQAANPVKIIMFGSRARGQERPDSDVDLLVIETQVENRVAEMTRLNRALRGLALPVELIVISAQLFDQWSRVPGSVYHEALREGIVLYDGA